MTKSAEQPGIYQKLQNSPGFNKKVAEQPGILTKLQNSPGFNKSFRTARDLTKVAEQPGI
jgi:hypothetical protein